jgi:UDP-3-O-[3-hydroxymyristoyl] glucosamine N-acyltransferase
VSFHTTTYHDLECLVSEHESYNLTRISPDDFLLCQHTLPGSYINLVTRDIDLRKQITNHLDIHQFDRFSIIHNQSYTSCANIALGCMIYPLVSIYPKTTLHRDVIIHSGTVISHQCCINVGTFISGGTTIAGNTNIGEFTQIGMDATIYDQISISPDTVIGAGTVVRKNIQTPGVYTTQLKNQLHKIK